MKPQCFGPLIDVQACEERILNCWPSHQTVVAGDWLCRFAQGYSGRANSAFAYRPDIALSETGIDHIEALYSAAALRPSFRLSPLTGEAVQARLEARGYRPEDGSYGMIGLAKGGAIPPSLHLDPSPTPEWLEGACRWQAASKRATSSLLGIVGNIRVPTRFATLEHEGEPAAFALVSLDRGMAEFGAVIVNPQLRGAGLGRTLVTGMIAWAESAGAGRIFLQVALENDIAHGLYRSLGFTDLYTAGYWRMPARARF